MRKLFVIRIAFIMGVATFAAITVFLRTQGKLPEPGPEQLAGVEQVRYMMWGFSAFAVVLALLMRTRTESAMTEAQMNSALIVGWAGGEGAALGSIVALFIGGSVATMAVGILAFIVVLLILRIPSPPR